MEKGSSRYYLLPQCLGREQAVDQGQGSVQQHTVEGGPRDRGALGRDAAAHRPRARARARAGPVLVVPVACFRLRGGVQAGSHHLHRRLAVRRVLATADEGDEEVRVGA